MATKTPKVSKPKEINISKENAEQIRKMTQDVIVAGQDPAVIKFNDLLQKRNNFIEAVAEICNVDFTSGGWTVNMEQGKFVEQLPSQNGTE